MGLLRKNQNPTDGSRETRCAHPSHYPVRTCRFEQMEPRQLLSATVLPIQVGAVYFEDSSGKDQVRDLIEVTFKDGAPDTELTRLTIETDKDNKGLSIGDVFFDIEPGSPGVYGSGGFDILDQGNITSVSESVVDGGMVLELTFDGFFANDKLVFAIDVDEQGSLSANAVAEGNEFELSRLTATFESEHHFDATGTDVFLDFYDQKLAAAGLELADDDYDPPSPYMPETGAPGPVYTAGAIFSLEQTPLPITIAGTVFEDFDMDNHQDDEPGNVDPGIRYVGLTLKKLDGKGYKSIATTETDEDGNYKFEGLSPGTYQVVETQPKDYKSVGASEGTVDNKPRGEVLNDDVITAVELKGGEDSVDNDFAEYKPASISGRVHAELNRDCHWDPGEPLLEGVTIYLLDASGERIAKTKTNDKGMYKFDDLDPGTYGIEEIQPKDYLDGPDHIGSEGGKLLGNDLMGKIHLGAGVDAIKYDFCEMVPATISGYVFQDGPPIRLKEGDPIPDPSTVRDGKLTDDDKRIAGVKLTLGDESGTPITDEFGSPITARTNSKGYYEFTMLAPGTYSVFQTHPDNYIDSLDSAGNRGGVAINPSDKTSEAVTANLAVDPRDDAIVLIDVDSGQNATNYNFSEVVVVRTPPLIPPPERYPDPQTKIVREPPLPGAPVPSPVYMPVSPIDIPQFLGGGLPPGWTWHLSIINAGQPRQDQSNVQSTHSMTLARFFDPETWTGPQMTKGLWVIGDGDGQPVKEVEFGLPNATPVAGDFNGDGVAEVGLFLDGDWFLDLNGNGTWDSEDLWAKLGEAGDLPVVGDWDGDGKTDIGIFGPAWLRDIDAIKAEPGTPDAGNRLIGKHKNVPPDPDDAAIKTRDMKRTAAGEIRSDLIDHVFRYGREEDQPIAGDFNGDGISTIGVFRNGTWHIDLDGNGRWSRGDATVELGRAGDAAVVGDFNNDGIDDLGVYRRGVWHLDTNGNLRLDAQDKIFELGGPSDTPVVADFDGDGADEIAVYRDGAIKGRSEVLP